jgi:hypothetical protein
VSKLLSFVACHGLSVTRSKAAAGRQSREAMVQAPHGGLKWRSLKKAYLDPSSPRLVQESLPQLPRFDGCRYAECVAAWHRQAAWWDERMRRGLCIVYYVSRPHSLC